MQQNLLLDLITHLIRELDTISVSANNYSLPIATNSVLGGFRTTYISDGVLSSTDTTYSVGDGGLTEKNFTSALNTKLTNLPVITTIGSNLSLDSGTLTSTNNWTLSSSDLLHRQLLQMCL